MLIATIKSGTVPPYLTAGKEYKVLKVMGESESGGRRFRIRDNHKSAINPNERNSAYLSGGDWELSERPEE